VIDVVTVPLLRARSAGATAMRRAIAASRRAPRPVSPVAVAVAVATAASPFVGGAAPAHAADAPAVPIRTVADPREDGVTAALVRRFVEEAWNAGRYDVVPAIFAPDYVAESLNAGTPPLGRQTHAQLVAHVREFRDAMPDLRMTIEEVVESRDRAFVRTRLTGTLRGSLFGLPPSGRSVDVVLAAVYRSADGRLTGHTVLVDMLGLLQQAGALPMPPGPPAVIDAGQPTSNAPSSAVASTAAAPTPRLIELKDGMRWVYRVSGSLQPAGAPAAVPLGGTITITVETREFRGRPTAVLRFAQALRPLGPPPTGAPPDPPGASPPPAGMAAAPHGAPPPPGSGASIFGAGAPPEGLFWFRQDPVTRDVYFVGDNHGPPGPDGMPSPRAATGSGGLFIPGAWRDGVAYSKRIDWEGGGWTQNWLGVLGPDTIVTGLGPRAAWRSPNRSASADGIAIDGTDWWAPELGQPVQFDANTRLPDGTTIRIRAVLDSTNVRA
jgi:steroid delta-isomerase-like uncharacterized protein